MESLDLLAHNIANATTTGFKAEREIYRQYSVNDDVSAQIPAIEGRWTDFSQGVIRSTGRSLDFALGGTGFFVAKTATGQQLFTRDGSFQISKDGRLLTRDGHELDVRTPDQDPLRLDPRLDVEISTDGTIRQAGQTLGTLRVVEFSTDATHEKLSGNYFSFSTPKPIDVLNPDIRQGHLEQSNVAAPEMGVRLVNVMRQFEMLNKALQLGADMNRRAIEEVAKVNG